MFQNIGTSELIIIAIVLFILLGPKRLPEFVRSLGESVKEFKKALNDEPEKKDEKN